MTSPTPSPSDAGDKSVELEVSHNWDAFLVMGLSIVAYLLVGTFILRCLMRQTQIPLAKEPRMRDFMIALGALVLWPLIVSILLLAPAGRFYRWLKG